MSSSLRANVCALAALLVILLLLIFVAVLLKTAPTTPGTAPHPYQQGYFAQLRYDARRVCAAASAINNTYTLNETNREWFAWEARVDAYISDQRILENARHIITPNYQDMANVVCPQ